VRFLFPHIVVELVIEVRPAGAFFDILVVKCMDAVDLAGVLLQLIVLGSLASDGRLPLGRSFFTTRGSLRPDLMSTGQYAIGGHLL